MLHILYRHIYNTRYILMIVKFKKDVTTHWLNMIMIKLLHNKSMTLVDAAERH